MAPTKTKAKLKWSNLAEGLCPKCGYKLEDPIDDMILCSSASGGSKYDCGFLIGKAKLKNILDNMKERKSW